MVPPNLLPATEWIQLWAGIQKGQAAEIGRFWRVILFARIACKNWAINGKFVFWHLTSLKDNRSRRTPTKLQFENFRRVVEKFPIPISRYY